MSSSQRFAALGAMGAIALGAVALLAGCAAPIDPSAARESLTEVTENPTPPVAAELYDAALHPDPIVDPRDCTAVLVVTARGTGEPSKGQLLSPVARAIAKAKPKDVDVLDLDYPADGDVNEGGTLGARTLIDTLNVQAEACPEQRFVLLGYSQGAFVIGDALSVPEARLVGGTVGSVSEAAAERVLAIVFYGDPRFVGSEPFNVGSFDPTANGLLPRAPGTLDAFADRLRDYCVARDFICQSGSLDLDESGHVEYFSNGMQQDGAAFVLAQLDTLAERDRSAGVGGDVVEPPQANPTP
ncbi:cutinase family protein [Leucobacter sp. VD1]|uniref:cutinase family protein n=1 Tax=Leucobacter sp. VD1 TaxID=3080381 RepID=UPI0030177857